MTEVSVSIPQEILKTEVLRMVTERAMGQSIVDAVAKQLNSYQIREEVERALKGVMYQIAQEHIQENPEIRALVIAAVQKIITTELLEKSVQHVVSKLGREW